MIMFDYVRKEYVKSSGNIDYSLADECKESEKLIKSGGVYGI